MTGEPQGPAMPAPDATIRRWELRIAVIVAIAAVATLGWHGIDVVREGARTQGAVTAQIADMKELEATNQAYLGAQLQLEASRRQKLRSDFDEEKKATAGHIASIDTTLNWIKDHMPSQLPERHADESIHDSPVAMFQGIER